MIRELFTVAYIVGCMLAFGFSVRAGIFTRKEGYTVATSMLITLGCTALSWIMVGFALNKLIDQAEDIHKKL
jgi:ammonia channel protein AmtB